MSTNIVSLFTFFTWNYQFSNNGLFFEKYYMLMSLQIWKVFYISVLYFQVVLSVIEKFSSGNSLFWYKTLTLYHHRTIYTWGQSEKSIVAWIQRISNESIHEPGRHALTTLHHTPTLEYSTCPTKSFSYKNCTQLDSLLSELLHNIDMWNAGLAHHKKLKLVLVRLTQHRPVLREPLTYKTTYAPFD